MNLHNVHVLVKPLWRTRVGYTSATSTKLSVFLVSKNEQHIWNQHLITESKYKVQCIAALRAMHCGIKS